MAKAKRPYCATSGSGRTQKCFKAKVNAQRKCQAVRRRGGSCRVLEVT